MKVLLLNPPGKELYLRDYYCSKISKANYINQPTDLVILSGILAKKHRVFVIDAIVEKLDESRTLEKIKQIMPQIIVFLSGSVSFEEDFPFMRRVKEQTNARIIGSGDIFMEDAVSLLKKHSFIDAALLDFTTEDILKWIENKKCNNIIYKNKGKYLVTKNFNNKFEIPIPCHELFKNSLYKYPLCKREPFATVLTNYGCPFRCSFCIMSKLRFKVRDPEEVIKELSFLKSLGIKEIYFNDQTFGVNREKTIDLLNKIAPLQLTWVCFSRVDVVDLEVLQLMKNAGCHTIMFGVESGNQQVLDKTKKGISKERILEVFKLCNQLGIKTLATFMIGLPGDTYDTCLETIEFAKEIDADFASFNSPVPRMGTDLRKDSIEKGLVSESLKKMDQSGSKIVMANEALTIEQLAELHKRAYREFYFRPSYILKRLFSIRTFTELKNYTRDGLAILKSK